MDDSKVRPVTTKRQKLAHLWERDPHDWYVEPQICSFALFREVEFQGPVWDPACGKGNIVTSARACSIRCVGTDLICRSDDYKVTHNFLTERPDFVFRDIVSNPPFRIAELFVQRALDLVPSGGKVAMILPLVWVAGFSSKRDWLPTSPLRAVLPISPRPSMPPGAVIVAGEKPGNGTKDYAWFVWEQGYNGAPRILFLNTNDYKSEFAGKRRAQSGGTTQRYFAY